MNCLVLQSARSDSPGLSGLECQVGRARAWLATLLDVSCGLEAAAGTSAHCNGVRGVADVHTRVY